MNISEPNSPCRDQSEKSIKKWLHSNVKVGAIVAIRRIEDGMLQYERAAVLSMRPKNFNVGVEQKDGTFARAGDSFDYSGRNWGNPRGPTRLVIPTQAVLAACGACQCGTLFLPKNAERYTYSVR
jgi:hypothetical protein